MSQPCPKLVNSLTACPLPCMQAYGFGRAREVHEGQSSVCSIVECLAPMKYIRAVEQLATKAMLIVHSHRAGSVSLLLIMGTRSSAG
jgi:hypothetical protein